VVLHNDGKAKMRREIELNIGVSSMEDVRIPDWHFTQHAKRPFLCHCMEGLLESEKRVRRLLDEWMNGYVLYILLVFGVVLGVLLG
jgi:hypothetical protein